MFGFVMAARPKPGGRWWADPTRLLDGVAPSLAADFCRDRYSIGGAYASADALLTVSSGSKRVVGPTWSLDTVGANTLAYDYSFGRRRLLVEARAATKYGPYSEAIGGTGYGLGNVSQGAASLGPDGTTGMREIVENTASGVAHNWWSWTIANANAAGEHWAHQIIVRRGVGARNVKIRNIGSAFTGAYPEVCINLGTGAILSSAAVNRVAVVPMTISGIGSCWRIEMTATTTQAGTVVNSAYFLSGTASNTDFYAGDGVSSIHFGYANVEKVGSANEPPSSYVTIPSTAAVTRISDDERSTSAAGALMTAATSSFVIRGRALWGSGSRVVIGGASAYLAYDPSTGIATLSDGTHTLTCTGTAGADFGIAVAVTPSGRTIAVQGCAAATTDAYGLFTVGEALRFGSIVAGTGNVSNVMVDDLAAWALGGSSAGIKAQARAWS